MEEFAERTKKIARFGLLVFVLLFSQWLSAQISPRAKNPSAGENYLFHAEEEFIFENQVAVFKLFVPETQASDVKITLPIFPQNADFVSSRSENFSSQNSGQGTQIVLSLIFKKAGTFSLPPVSLSVRGRKKNAAFPAIKVLQNPETLFPRAILVFESGETFSSDEPPSKKFSIVRGMPSRFTLCVQYAAALGQISWQLPKDAIFKELRRFEIPSDLKKFSLAVVPVAQFEWTSLSQEDDVSLPQIKIAAESYSGQKLFLETPDFTVKIVSQKQGSKNESMNKPISEMEKFFEHAFDLEGEEQDADSENAALEANALLEIARLRSLERHSFFQGKIRAERAAAEKSLGIENAPNEKSFPLFAALLSATFFFFALAFTLFFVRRKNFAFAAAALAILLSLFSLLYSSEILKRHGIVLGGEIYPVPEDSVVSKASLVVSSRVLIRREIDSWYFIEYNESGGWIKKENIALIK